MENYNNFSIRVIIPEHEMWFGTDEERELIFAKEETCGIKEFAFTNGQAMLEWKTKKGAEKNLEKAERVWLNTVARRHLPSETISKCKLYIHNYQCRS